MSQHISAKKVAVSHSSVARLMLLCGLVGATAASAATLNDEVPALKVRYTMDSLATDHGAKVLYTRLVHAAEQVCPADFESNLFVSAAVKSCREQAVARAVHQINNSRLAAVYSATTKRG
jgi:UrcA family protein